MGNPPHFSLYYFFYTPLFKNPATALPLGPVTALFTLTMSVRRSPIQPRSTPTFHATPPQTTAIPLSGTVIPETPPNEGEPMGQQLEGLSNTMLLVLLSEAISNISSIKTTTGSNPMHMAKAKTSLEKAKTIVQNLLNEEEKEKQQTMELMSKDLQDIKRLLSKPTFAQVVATELPKNPNAAKDKMKKQQREKLTIVITAATATDTIKNELKSMHAKDMIQKCQNAITKYFKEGHVPKIHGINKLSNDEYRLHCESKEDPQLLSKLDWNLIFSGVRTKKRKYGLVLHGVPKQDLDPNIEDETILKDEIEEENTSRNLQVAQVIPLRRSQKHLNKIAAHHSIVIFTHSIEEADECLKCGMSIKGRFYYPEKYTPELNITQCYKCYKFGHLAKHCKNKPKCGNCGNEDHDAANCSNNTKCAGCGDSHPAWHIECSKRDEEGSRLKALKQVAANSYSE